MAVWCINIQYFDVHHNYPNTVRHYRHPTWIYLGDHINYYQFWCSPRAGVDWWNRDAKPGHEWLNRNPWRNKYASTEAIPNNIIIYNLLWYYPPNILSSRYVCWRFQGKKRSPAVSLGISRKPWLKCFGGAPETNIWFGSETTTSFGKGVERWKSWDFIIQFFLQITGTVQVWWSVCI